MKTFAIEIHYQLSKEQVSALVNSQFQQVQLKYLLQFLCLLNAF